MQADRKIAAIADGADLPKEPPVRVASKADTFQASPARDLQRVVESAYYEPVIEPWPAPVRAMILVGGSIGLWGALGAAAFAILKH